MKTHLSGRAIKLGSARDLTKAIGGTETPELENPMFLRKNV